MARAVFLLLLLANLLFFVWAAGYLGRDADGHEPDRVRQQLQPERLLVARPGERLPAAPQLLCRQVGPMSTAIAERFLAGLTDQGEVTAASRPVEGASYWVHVPAMANKAAAEKKAAEIRQLGIDDFFIVNDGPNRNAISLGLFHTEATTDELLKRLAAKGLKSARVEVRERATDKVRLEVRGPRADLERRLAGLAVESVMDIGECPN